MHVDQVPTDGLGLRGVDVPGRGGRGDRPGRLVPEPVVAVPYLGCGGGGDREARDAPGPDGLPPPLRRSRRTCRLRRPARRPGGLPGGGAAGAGAVEPARSAATSSRTPGATSWAKSWMLAGSSVPRTNPEVPCSSTRSVSSRTHCRGGPSRKPAPVPVNRPETFSNRRTRAGSRPAAVAPSSTSALSPARSAGPFGRYASEGSQPSAVRPTSRSSLGLYAPTQIPTGCAGAGPRLAPTTR